MIQPEEKRLRKAIKSTDYKRPEAVGIDTKLELAYLAGRYYGFDTGVKALVRWLGKASASQISALWEDANAD